jgi:hypothetical protein
MRTKRALALSCGCALESHGDGRSMIIGTETLLSERLEQTDENRQVLHLNVNPGNRGGDA